MKTNNNNIDWINNNKTKIILDSDFDKIRNIIKLLEKKDERWKWGSGIIEVAELNMELEDIRKSNKNKLY